MSKTSEVIDIRRNSPNMSMTEIASLVGASRQGVYQILRHYGFPTWVTKTKLHCRICDIAVDTEAKFRYNKEKCSQCRIKANVVYATCDWCDAPLIRKTYLDRGKFHWCDKHCQGKWVGSIKKGEQKREAHPITR